MVGNFLEGQKIKGLKYLQIITHIVHTMALPIHGIIQYIYEMTTMKRGQVLLVHLA